MFKLLIKNIIYKIRAQSVKMIPGTLNSQDDKNLRIESNVSFGGNVFLGTAGPISIGEGSMIAYGVVINTSTHDYNSHPMWAKRIDRPIKIGKFVWIGAGAIILPGVIIEDNAVIGAGSVVTANVPKGAIVVGIPARIIKYRDERVFMNDPTINFPHEGLIIKEDYIGKFCK